MYVCICHAVTDKQIRRARAAGVSNLSDLGETLGVATCCGSCADHAEAILNAEPEEVAERAPRTWVPSAA